MRRLSLVIVKTKIDEGNGLPLYRCPAFKLATNSRRLLATMMVVTPLLQQLLPFYIHVLSDGLSGAQAGKTGISICDANRIYRAWFRTRRSPRLSKLF